MSARSLPIKVEGLQWNTEVMECVTDDIKVAIRARNALRRTRRTAELNLTLGEGDHRFMFGRLWVGVTQSFVIDRVTLVFTGEPAYFKVKIGLGDDQLEGPFTTYQEAMEYWRGIKASCSIIPFLD